MKRALIALALGASIISLGACADGYGGGGHHLYAYEHNPVSYDGYYDDFYGPVYDGYWGDEGFYYSTGEGHPFQVDRGNHFRHENGGAGFHEYHGGMHRAGGGEHHG